MVTKYKLHGYVIPRWTGLDSSNRPTIYPYGVTIDDYRSLIGEIVEILASDPQFMIKNIVNDAFRNGQIYEHL